MNKNLETKFTGWALIVGAVMLFTGWVLLPHHTGEYIKLSDFDAIGQDLWYWIWMFRVHIFGWVIMGGAMIAFAILTNKQPYRIITVPGAGIVTIGTFTMALAVAFYYSYGAWGVGKTMGMPVTESQTFIDGVTMINHYATCLVRFGRVFSGAGFVLLGYGLFKWAILDKWIGIFTILMGLAAMGIIMLIPDCFDLYKPLFYVKIIWLVTVGVSLIRKGINLPQLNN